MLVALYGILILDLWNKLDIYRFGRGLQRSDGGGSTINRLQQLAGGGSPQRSPRIKEERRSRSPRESRHSRDSYSRRRSPSREQRERHRSRSPPPPPLPPSSNYTPPPPPPSRSPYRDSRSRSRSPPPRRPRSPPESISPSPPIRNDMSYSRWTLHYYNCMQINRLELRLLWKNGCLLLTKFVSELQCKWKFLEMIFHQLKILSFNVKIYNYHSTFKHLNIFSNWCQ